MKNSIHRIILAALLVLLASFPALAGGGFMGINSAVVADDAHDVTRNPALMLEQRQTHGVALLAMYIPYSNATLSLLEVQHMSGAPEIEFSKTKAGSNLTWSEKYNTTVGLSYVYTKKSIAAFGIGLQTSAERTLTNGTVSSITSQGAVPAIMNVQEYTTKMKPSVTLSTAFRLYKNGSLGLQVKQLYSISTTESMVKGYLAVPALLQNKEYKSTREIITTPAIGFLHSWKTSQVGILVQIGDISYRQWQTRFTNIFISPLGPGGARHGSTKLPRHLALRSGPTIMIGAYTRPTSLVGLSLGFDYTTPVVYRDPTAYYFDPLFTYYYRKLKMRKEAAVTIKGGVELHLSNWFVVSAGLSYITSVITSEDNRVYRTISLIRGIVAMNVLIATAGVQWYVTDRTRVSLGVSYLDNMLAIDSRVMMGRYKQNNTRIKPGQLLTVLSVSGGF